ncbi:hypothetical protein RclHR1_32400002 [Rhizophagus clarus]|uniref:Integrase catalytic domain-containing protein n=1 Tax=Rhizophagus clarus TaxID=94130 RepID=A0A2Z6RN01_9GLOM|nr:hypothetical protein RclHR1_32400002 [Rhizophagus clarus]
MPALLPLITIIQIDSGEARDLDVGITLQKIYYQPVGYQRNAKKLHKASLDADYDFSLDEVRDWLERQAVHQIHKPRPKYIPRASFCSIITPNKVHQADVLYMPYDKIGWITYLFCLNIVDVASRYKVSIPIGAYSVKDRQGILTSKTIARALKEKYDDPECPLVWPETFLTDRGPEFRSDCEKLMREYGVKIQKAFTKDTMVVKYFNNFITCQLGISPDDAIVKEEVLAKPSYPRDGPIGFDKEKLSSDVLVRYLLYPSDLEGGRRRAGDLNWSPHIYHIC